MPYPENTEKNRFELAGNIVDTWSMEDLREYVIRELESDYRDGLGCFEEHWDDFKDSFEWSENMVEVTKEKVEDDDYTCTPYGEKK